MTSNAHPIITLNNGKHFPALGFGTYSSVHGQAHKATLHALRSGFRHLDTAWGYQNEEEVGQAVADFLKERPDVKRSDIWVTTKVPDHMHASEDVEYAVNDSLKKLGLDYVDLVLIHWPIALEKKNNEGHKEIDGEPVVNEALTKDPKPTWQALEKIHDSGKAKSIGVSNWTIKGLESLLSYARIPPAVNQVEAHPLLPNQKLLDYMITKKIVLAAYSPLGGQGADNPLFSDEKLAQVAKKYNHTIQAILIAWGIKRGYAVLPKSFTPKRIEANVNVIDLSEEEFQAVQDAVGGRRIRTCPFYASKAIGLKYGPEAAEESESAGKK